MAITGPSGLTAEYLSEPDHGSADSMAPRSMAAISILTIRDGSISMIAAAGDIFTMATGGAISVVTAVAISEAATAGAISGAMTTATVGETFVVAAATEAIISAVETDSGVFRDVVTFADKVIFAATTDSAEATTGSVATAAFTVMAVSAATKVIIASEETAGPTAIVVSTAEDRAAEIMAAGTAASARRQIQNGPVDGRRQELPAVFFFLDPPKESDTEIRLHAVAVMSTIGAIAGGFRRRPVEQVSHLGKMRQECSPGKQLKRKQMGGKTP
jgi:hypothetical protein